MKIFFTCLLLLNISFHVQAQSPALPCCDAAQLFNNFLIEKGNTFYRIGDFKVMGSPYLFGEDQMGTVYSSSAGEHHINIRYNIHTQFLETTTKNDKGPVSIDLDNIDSFTLVANKEHPTDIKFINRKLFADGKKGFLMIVHHGKPYSLYKVYRTSLVQTITMRAEQRQFEIEYDYYYSHMPSKQLKLLRPNASFLKKEFSNKMDIKSFLNENSTLSAEPLLTLLISKLNQ